MRPEELEIMAPAGSFESLTAAVQGGANSVYFGIGHLNMRSHSANNFQAEDLPEVMRICRAYGLKALPISSPRCSMPIMSSPIPTIL